MLGHQNPKSSSASHTRPPGQFHNQASLRGAAPDWQGKLPGGCGAGRALGETQKLFPTTQLYLAIEFITMFTYKNEPD